MTRQRAVGEDEVMQQQSHDEAADRALQRVLHSAAAQLPQEVQQPVYSAPAATQAQLQYMQQVQAQQFAQAQQYAQAQPQFAQAQPQSVQQVALQGGPTGQAQDLQKLVASAVSVKQGAQSSLRVVRVDAQTSALRRSSWTSAPSTCRQLISAAARCRLSWWRQQAEVAQQAHE